MRQKEWFWNACMHAKRLRKLFLTKCTLMTARRARAHTIMIHVRVCSSKEDAAVSRKISSGHTPNRWWGGAMVDKKKKNNNSFFSERRGIEAQQGVNCSTRCRPKNMLPVGLMQLRWWCHQRAPESRASKRWIYERHARFSKGRSRPPWAFLVVVTRFVFQASECYLGKSGSCGRIYLLVKLIKSWITS